MPLYDFRDNRTGEEWEAFMSYDSMKELTQSGDITIVYKNMAIIGGRGDRVKTDNGFKEVLSKVAEAHPNSALADRHGSKDNKTIKTREIIAKHKKK